MSKLKVNQIEAQSGSDVFLTGSLTVSETLTARTLRTELTQSIVLNQSGSTKIGDTSDDTHQFTGSLFITGSTTITEQLNLGGFTDLSSSLDAAESAIENNSQSAHQHRIAMSESKATALRAEITALSSSAHSQRTSEDSVLSGSAHTQRNAISSSTATALRAEITSLSGSAHTQRTSEDSVLSGSAHTQRNAISSSTATGLRAEITSLSSSAHSQRTSEDSVLSASAHSQRISEDSVLSGSAHTQRAALNTSATGRLDSIEALTSSLASTGSNTFTGNTIISSSVLLTLQPVDTLTGSADTGSLQVSSSGDIYIYNGGAGSDSGVAGWAKINVTN